MKDDEKLELIKRNTEEIVTDQELKELLKKKNPRVYCGYEPSGPIHLGHFVTITKLMDLQKAGFHIVILLADVHALLNRKGSEKEIKKEVENWRKTIKAIGIKAEIALGSDFEFNKEYQLDVMNLAQDSTINRGLRSMQEIARDVDNATISQLWYPLMQIVDIKHLKLDAALGGMEQRKIHMMGRDMGKTLDHKYIAIHTPLITSLKGPGQKMSKSVPGSGISVTDSYEEIKNSLKNAYCPPKETKDNPVLQIAKLIIFPRHNQLLVKGDPTWKGKDRDEEDKLFTSYQELETKYERGYVYPLNLKNAVAEALEKIIGPIRKKWK